MMLTTLYVGLVATHLAFKDVWISGLLAGAAAVLLLPDAKFAQRVQLSLLVVIGIVLLVFAMRQGASVRWSAMLSQNTGLLCMLFAVSLLKMIVITAASAQQKLPIGRTAFVHTLLTVTTLGSIINISALVVVADRLSLNRPLDYFAAGTTVRAFSACAAWSPFFAGMAVVLTAVGDEHVWSIMAYGLPLTCLFLVVLVLSGVFITPETVDAFHGYPMKWESFVVPVCLAGLVVVINYLFPNVHILSVIALSSIALTVLLLCKRQGVNATIAHMKNYITRDLPSMVGELQLFLSAGILAFGLQALVEAGSMSPPIDAYTGGAACMLLAALVIAAALGLHPIILIASLTPILSVVSPDPVLLGLTYIFGWSLGTCVSPLSGTNLIMQGRFGINALKGAMQNWPYIAVLFCFACVILLVRGAVTNL